MKDLEFKTANTKSTIQKWGIRACHLLKDPAEWAARKSGLFVNKKKLAEGFYFHFTHKLHTCLTKGMPPELDRLACSAFRNILCYAGDKPTPYPYLAAVEVVLAGINHPEL